MPSSGYWLQWRRWQDANLHLPNLRDSDDGRERDEAVQAGDGHEDREKGTDKPGGGKLLGMYSL